jgi:hypothetical protein
MCCFRANSCHVLAWWCISTNQLKDSRIGANDYVFFSPTEQARMLSSPSRSSLSQPRAPGAKAAHDMTKCAVGHAGPKFWDEMKARSEAVPMYDDV